MERLFSLRCRRLVNTIGFDAYARGLEDSGGIAVESSYLASAEVYGVFTRGDALVGGFILCSPPRRTLGFLPSDVRARLENSTADLQMTDAGEICCVWVHRDHRSPLLRMSTWAFVTIRVFTAPQRFFLAYSRKPALQRLCRLGRPRLIWEDPGGETRLFAFTAWNILLALAFYPVFRVSSAARRLIQRSSPAEKGPVPVLPSETHEPPRRRAVLDGEPR